MQINDWFIDWSVMVLRRAAIISILPCIQWRDWWVFTTFQWSFDDKLVHISDTVKSKRTMSTFRHTALLTRVHSTPSSYTSEICSRLTSEMRPDPRGVGGGHGPPRHVCKRPECTSRRFQTQIENFSGMTTLHRSRLALHRCIKSQRSIQQLVLPPRTKLSAYTHQQVFHQATVSGV